MRRGRKSASKRFDSSKVPLTGDSHNQLMTAGTVLFSSAPGSQQVLRLVEGSEENARGEVAKTIGDCAFHDYQRAARSSLGSWNSALLRVKPAPILAFLQ